METISEVIEDPSLGLIVEVAYQGHLYKFRHKGDGRFRCFWWDSSHLNTDVARKLNPIALDALKSYREGKSERISVARPHRQDTSSDALCPECGAPLGSVEVDTCPSCDARIEPHSKVARQHVHPQKHSHTYGGVEEGHPVHRPRNPRHWTEPEDD